MCIWNCDTYQVFVSVLCVLLGSSDQDDDYLEVVEEENVSLTDVDSKKRKSYDETEGGISKKRRIHDDTVVIWVALSWYVLQVHI